MKLTKKALHFVYEKIISTVLFIMKKIINLKNL